MNGPSAGNKHYNYNVFLNKDPTKNKTYGYSTTINPNRAKLSYKNEQTTISSIYNRISLDCCMSDIRHVRLDKNGRFLEVINSQLDECLNLSANVDQTGRAFRQDIIISMLDEGHVALVPTWTDSDIEDESSYKICEMRTGKILEWFPSQVKVRLYNDITGMEEDITLSKNSISIIENPFFIVMNEPNSTMQRLIRKLNLLDAIDTQSGSGKLDLIVQLPFQLKNNNQKRMVKKRQAELEEQLSDSKFGIGYIDGTEKITQLNRPVDNNLMAQIEYLTKLLMSQLGMTQEILDGTADANTMNNYMTRIIEPCLSAVVDGMKRSFLTKTARSQNQSIMFFRDPLKLIPANQIAEMSDKLTRNEIVTSNEIRQSIGMAPSQDPSADELRNKNLSAPSDEEKIDVDGNVIIKKKKEVNVPNEKQKV